MPTPKPVLLNLITGKNNTPRTATLQQVDNFQKVSLVDHFIKEFEPKLYMSVKGVLSIGKGQIWLAPF